MGKSRSVLLMFVASATVFVSSACIMILELVAGRLIARHLGSSLYTWTSIIGVVLAGIAIGNYLGGRIADRFQAKKALAVLFTLSSIACVTVVVLNNLIGAWTWLWHFSWPVRIFTHISFVFLAPSTLLGTISPVVAKMALDQGLPTGRTVGDIYAWGAAGSIAGTFLAGFYLIATFGTITIVWAVSGVMLIMALLYWMRFWALHAWAIMLMTLAVLAMAPTGWAQAAGVALALREQIAEDIIYEDESPYCYVAVKRLSENPEKRSFMQDKLVHSSMEMDNLLDLKYSYEQIYAAVTNILRGDKTGFSVLVIGGGGYVYPRYVQQIWPGSRVDVVEIDPGVTQAAMQAFGLETNTPINIFTMDARNYVNGLLEQERTGGQQTRYDFIYEDALNDYSVPYQLTTKEFNESISRLLTDNGAYMIELIDIYDSGLFIGAFINTLKQTFPYVHVVAEREPRSIRNTFVLIAAKSQLSLDGLARQRVLRDMELWILDDDEIEELRRKSGEMVLTDNYAPVENLLAPVVLRSARGLLAEEYRSQALTSKDNGDLGQSISWYRKFISASPVASVEGYNEIGILLAHQGKTAEAIEEFKQALEYNKTATDRRSVSDVYYNMAAAFQRLGREDQATEYMNRAISSYKEDMIRRPGSVKVVTRLGNALASNGRFSEASDFFQKAVDLDPTNVQNHLLLAQALVIQDRQDQAIEALEKAVAFFSQAGADNAAAGLRSYLRQLEAEKPRLQE